LIVLPQIIVALMAPWVGRQAENWGRRPLLLIGFGALPVRALLFSLVADPPLLFAFQLLDGISGAVVGVITALVIADATNGTGRFNLAQGLIGTASGIGASLSTALFGLIAVSFGQTIAFLSIATVALVLDAGDETVAGARRPARSDLIQQSRLTEGCEAQFHSK
jgi:MFS family permease